MEIDYGGTKILRIPNENDISTRYVIFLQCEYGNLTKGYIKTHPERKRSELQLHYNLKCPCYPKTYRDMGSINRHLYKKCAVTT